MNLLKISSVQRDCVYDGPGIRTTVFLVGCHLHCPWCCNPETQSVTGESTVYIDTDRCLKARDINSPLCKDCSLIGGANQLEKCPFKAYEHFVKEYAPSELIDEIEKDTFLYEDSNGGITFSGGEPFLQINELIPVLEALHKNNYNIAFETTLYFHSEVLRKALSFANVFIVDLKLQPENGLLGKSRYHFIINNNLTILRESSKHIFFRIVFVNSVWSAKERILYYLKSYDVRKIEILKCHNLARKKYLKLGRNNIDYTPDDELLQQFSLFLKQNMISNIILSV